MNPAPFNNRIRASLREGLRVLLRSYPGFGGVGRLMISHFVNWLTADTGAVLTTLRNGEAIVVDLTDHCARAIYFWGDYDPRVSRICIEALRPGDVMLDIGANYGEIALAAVARVGSTGAVHAFEPNPKVSRYLAESVELNGFTNLFVHEVALGAEDGEVELVAPDGNSGAASVVAFPGGAAYKSISYGRVKIRAGGDYLRKVLRSPISVIKIDVEGMEGPVLESIEPLLRENPPRVVCFESHPSETPFYERPPVRCLARLGYRFEQVKGGIGLHRRPTLVPVPISGPIYISHDFVGLRG